MSPIFYSPELDELAVWDQANNEPKTILFYVNNFDSLSWFKHDWVFVGYL